MSEIIRNEAVKRGISRLCHFTPSRNLVHIITDPRGLLATQHLLDNEKAVFNQTDLLRLDGHPGFISCSIEYPNAWYFRKAREKDRIFLDWVVLLIHPQLIWSSGTKFCHRNAAAGGGAEVNQGDDAFNAMFAPSVVGAYGKTFVRNTNRSPAMPTDEQAEVLVPDSITREDILGIAVSDVSQAKREVARMQALSETIPRIIIAPAFFDAPGLSSLISKGSQPQETEFNVGGDNG